MAAEASAVAKVAEADKVKEEKEAKEISGVRGNDTGAAKEAQEQEAGDAPNEGRGSKGKGEEQVVAGTETTATAEEDSTIVVSRGDSGVDGDNLAKADAAALCPSTPAPSQDGKGAVAAHEGRERGEDIVRGGTEDSHGEHRKSGGKHDRTQDDNLAGGRDGTEGTMSCEAREAEAEATGEQVQRVFATFARLFKGSDQGEYFAESNYGDV